jgi:ATP-dependent exoDNAse (exonuclease V) alpha subunit
MTAGGFYHCSVKNVGRSNGRSIVAAAAYRSGERLADERTGETADYRARGGVVDTFILARDDGPAWAHDRARLWNEAERAEPRANGRLATEFELALPHELTDAQRKQLVKDYLAPIIEKHGIAADVAIHAPGEGKDHRNVHAHVLLTHRQLDAHGFGDIANTRMMSRKRKGKDVFEQVAGIAATPADIKAIRKDWEQAINREYERQGLDIRVDHRSHKERGIEQEPTKHLGPTVIEMEKTSRDRATAPPSTGKSPNATRPDCWPRCAKPK